MTHESIEHRLGLLLEACADGDAGTRAAGPPASDDQIEALERHWGRRLPPLYRRVLGVHNGIPRLWFDVALLSVETIIGGSREMRAFEATSPAHGRWIFACGTESRDALAFDPSQAADDGELAVVHLSEAGVVARWPSLKAVLQELTTRLFTGVRGRGTTTYYLWTGLWTFWPGGSSPHSRVFTAGSDAAQYAGRGGLFARSGDIETGRLLPDENLTEADRRFLHAVREIGAEEQRLAILLTDGPAEPSATSTYVYYEPCADLVTALSTAENQASVCATDTLWGQWGDSFDTLTAIATQLLKQGRITEALQHSIDGTCELFRRMRERTAPRA
jgi:hypothetical protein